MQFINNEMCEETTDERGFVYTGERVNLFNRKQNNRCNYFLAEIKYNNPDIHTDTISYTQAYTHVPLHPVQGSNILWDIINDKY